MIIGITKERIIKLFLENYAEDVTEYVLLNECTELQESDKENFVWTVNHWETTGIHVYSTPEKAIECVLWYHLLDNPKYSKALLNGLDEEPLSGIGKEYLLQELETEGMFWFSWPNGSEIISVERTEVY